MTVKTFNRLSVKAGKKRPAPMPERFNSFYITISNHQRVKKINSRLLKKISAAILTELKIEKAAIEINLVGEKKMAEVNWQFLQHEGSTDVITFDYGNSELHGEIFICVDEAVSQAKKFKTNWQSEIVRYVVHGILHLLGYDDLKPNLRRKMKREENRLVRRLAQKISFAQLARAAKLRP